MKNPAIIRLVFSHSYRWIGLHSQPCRPDAGSCRRLHAEARRPCADRQALELFFEQELDGLDIERLVSDNLL
jgi:hypothetical protein